MRVQAIRDIPDCPTGNDDAVKGDIGTVEDEADGFFWVEFCGRDVICVEKSEVRRLDRESLPFQGLSLYLIQ